MWKRLFSAAFGAVGVVSLSSGAARAGETATVFDHSTDSSYFVGGQLNFITQYHPDFAAKYSGPNSLQTHAETATSLVLSGYLGLRVTSTTEIYVDLESAAGAGISRALGLAGFTNLDVVRNPTLGANPYIARFFVRQTIPLGGGFDEQERGHLEISRRVARDRIELSIGKMSTVDTFDVNEVGSDSHNQFMNWTIDNNGAYDYAADTRGYTYGAVAQLFTPRFSARFGEMLMPTVANGIDLDFHLDRSRAENLEVALQGDAIAGRHGAVKLLGFTNHAPMGSYRQAIDAFLAHRDMQPDVDRHAAAGRIKYGVGLNMEQELPLDLRFFLRAGWQEGAYESFAYTEVNDTFATGFDLGGARWWRPRDKLAVAVATNGLSSDHREYLALGGKGFLLGDGALAYAREMILESYYNALLFRGITTALDLQLIENPGYNHDRGPVTVLSLRVHLEL